LTFLIRNLNVWWWNLIIVYLFISRNLFNRTYTPFLIVFTAIGWKLEIFIHHTTPYCRSLGFLELNFKSIYLSRLILIRTQIFSLCLWKRTTNFTIIVSRENLKRSSIASIIYLVFQAMGFEAIFIILPILFCQLKILLFIFV
jgi:hypothetical protein